MKDAIQVYCKCCKGFIFAVYKYENGTLDYIECAECGENIVWNEYD